MQKNWEDFDTFLVNKWGESSIDINNVDEKLQYKIRKNAYHNLMSVIKKSGVADVHTIRRWFGIGNTQKPNRETFFRLAFALKLTAREANEYLVEGLRMPEIQVNDYEEIIFLYGLDNGIEYKRCVAMLEVFEACLVDHKEPEQVTQTEKIKELYASLRSKSEEEFLIWMKDNRQLFKGYSKTTLNYYIKLINEIHQWIKKEAKEYLFHLLDETDMNKKIALESSEDLGKYIAREKRKKRYSKSLIKSIWHYYRIVYLDVENNSDLLEELYSSVIVIKNGKKLYQKIDEYKLPKNMTFLTDKQLSDRLRIATQKVYYINLVEAKAILATKEDTEKCPLEVLDLLASFRRKKIVQTVADAKKEVEYLAKQQRQRCHLIQRDDLLVLIYYIAQKKYIEDIDANDAEYNKNDAKDVFLQMANSIFAACGMVELSESYEMDAFLLEGFGEKELYSMAELIEHAEVKKHE